jgi:energy-converting hydrogenase Eha subunit C
MKIPIVGRGERGVENGKLWALDHPVKKIVKLNRTYTLPLGFICLAVTWYYINVTVNSVLAKHK